MFIACDLWGDSEACDQFLCVPFHNYIIHKVINNSVLLIIYTYAIYNNMLHRHGASSASSGSKRNIYGIYQKQLLPVVLTLAASDTMSQLPPERVYLPLPIRAKISSGVSSGPLAKGVNLFEAGVRKEENTKSHLSLLGRQLGEELLFCRSPISKHYF